MPEKESSFDDYQVPIIRYKGEFDWQGLYRLCRLWLEENRYLYFEKRYKHKGDEVEVEMESQRKIDEMHRYHIFVDFHIWFLKDVEVMERGKKVRRNTGDLQVKIYGTVELDYSDRFGGSDFTKKLRKWWIDVRREEINALHHDKILKEMFRLHTDIKTFLNMHTDANYYT